MQTRADAAADQGDADDKRWRRAVRRLRLLVWQAVADAQYDGRLPWWFIRNASVDCFDCQTDARVRMVEVTLWKQPADAADYKWETNPLGGKWLLHTDPKTRKQGICVTRDQPNEDLVTLFKVKVDLMMAATEILSQTDMTALDPYAFNLGNFQIENTEDRVTPAEYRKRCRQAYLLNLRYREQKLAGIRARLLSLIARAPATRHPAAIAS